jgi:hypothetical protein
MNIPSIDSLHKEKYVKDKSKADIFTIVLNKCIEKIVYTNRHTDKTFVIFEVPKILIGYPSYDMKMCILFLLNRLSQHGYYLSFIDPFYLYIDWGSNNKLGKDSLSTKILTSNPDNLKRQTRSLLKKFPNTSKVQFVYAEESTSKTAKKIKRKSK